MFVLYTWYCMINMNGGKANEKNYEHSAAVDAEWNLLGKSS